MWFWLSIAAMLCWSGSDLFSKIGCADARDRFSHLKMVSAVGLVMGLHAAYSIFFGGVTVTWRILLTYLPVSALYILSMAIGYFGLHYIELSISSPICNSSGALVAVLTLCTVGIGELVPMQLAATGVICAGVLALGIIEAREDEELRAARQEKGNYRYAKSWLAIALPVIYCLLDALATFADNRVLELLDEDSANAAYELTFLFVGLCCFVWTFFVKKQRLLPKKEAPKLAGAVFETAGQFAYIYAIADTAHFAMSAPIISAYCAVSVLWSRIFLREKLSKKHYCAILAIVAGVAVLGFFDG